MLCKITFISFSFSRKIEAEMICIEPKLFLLSTSFNYYEVFSFPHLTLFFPTVKFLFAQIFYGLNQLRYLNLFETIYRNVKLSIETNLTSYKYFKLFNTFVF